MQTETYADVPTHEVAGRRPTYPVRLVDGAVPRPAEVVPFGGFLFARSAAGPWVLLDGADRAGLRDTDD